jgi:undecaprenyl-diphosphatase
VDQKLLFLINQEWTNSALDRVMAIASSFDLWVLPMAVLGLLICWRGSFRARAFLVVAVLAVAMNDGLISRNLKRLADRPRPHQVLPGVRIVDLAKAKFRLAALGLPLKIKASKPNSGEIDGRSLPSSHTMNTMAVALVCTAFYRRRGWLAFIPAAIVGYSRIYTGAHWPSDVVISVFLGLGTTLLLLATFERVWRKAVPRLFPAFAQAHPSLLRPGLEVLRPG